MHTTYHPCLGDHVTWFDLWSVGARCLQLALLETYATSPSLSVCDSLCVYVCVCVCVCVCVPWHFQEAPVFAFALLPSSFHFQSLFPVHCCLSLWFCHHSLLSLCDHFLNKQCLFTFKYQDHCYCCVKENCLAQLPAALCCNSPLGGIEKLCKISTYVYVRVHLADLLYLSMFVVFLQIWRGIIDPHVCMQTHGQRHSVA